MHSSPDPFSSDRTTSLRTAWHPHATISKTNKQTNKQNKTKQKRKRKRNENKATDRKTRGTAQTHNDSHRMRVTANGREGNDRGRRRLALQCGGIEEVEGATKHGRQRRWKRSGGAAKKEKKTKRHRIAKDTRRVGGRWAEREKRKEQTSMTEQMVKAQESSGVEDRTGVVMRHFEHRRESERARANVYECANECEE
jgi:hypothetical protein